MEIENKSYCFSARLRAALLVVIFTCCSLSAYCRNLLFSSREAAQVAIVVRDLSTGCETMSVNPDLALTPASITKCVTSAAIFAANMVANRFETPVYITGEITDGVLDGSVIISGNGDPTTGLRSFPRGVGLTDSIVSALAMRGIKHISGSIFTDCSFLPAQGPNSRWEIGDTEWSYGAGLYAINYNGNTQGIDRALPDPPEAFTSEVENALAAANISVEWGEDDLPAVEHRVLLTSHHSADFEEILKVMMVRSDNLFAEGMLRALAPGSTLKEALAREKSLLAGAGLNTANVGLFDGSGLSRNDRFSSRFLANLLAVMASRPDAARYVSLFPLAGCDGTVKKLLRSTRLAGKLALKSGSMMGVLCYAGYKLDDNNKPTHAVVIMVNGFFCPVAEVRKSIQNFLLQTFP